MNYSLPALISTVRPATLDQLTLHLASGTGVISLGYNAAGVTVWYTLASGSTAIPVNEIPYGTGTGLTSTPNLIYDPNGGSPNLYIRSGTGSDVFNFTTEEAHLDFYNGPHLSITLDGSSSGISFSGAGAGTETSNLSYSSLLGIDSSGVISTAISFSTGALFQTPSSPAAMQAVENDYPITAGWVRAIGNGAGTSLTGMVPEFTTLIDGQMLTLTNIGATVITVQHQNAGSAANNRIITKSGAATAIAAGGSMNFRYSLAVHRWYEV